MRHTQQTYCKIEHLVCGCVRVHIRDARKQDTLQVQEVITSVDSLPLFYDMPDTFNLYETVCDVIEEERRHGRLYQSLI